jgi:hypothetical protein
MKQSGREESATTSFEERWGLEPKVSDELRDT